MRASTKQRRVWLIVLGLVFFAAFLVITVNFFLSQREPFYEGRSLSYWLDRAMTHASSSSIMDNDEYTKEQEEKAAIRHIGTNAIPRLLHMIREAADLPLQKQWNEWAFRRNHNNWHIRDALDERRTALNGFNILGTQAAPAIPRVDQTA